MITIIDYGSGNISAIANIYERLNIAYKIAKTPTEIIGSEKLFLPGVGAFDETMLLLESSGFKNALDREVLVNKIPIIGICVGMQVLASIGHEFQINSGLGWIDGEIIKLNNDTLPLPHVGWNSVSKLKESRLLDGIENDSDFYFVHSYVFKPVNKNFIIATTIYNEDFCSVIECNNIYGVQFHPEKSHIAGKKLIENFISIKNS